VWKLFAKIAEAAGLPASHRHPHVMAGPAPRNLLVGLTT
jgi:hypothetical protein